MENNVQWRNIMEHQTNSRFTDYSCKDFITVLSGKSPVREAEVPLPSPARSVSLLEIWSGVLPLEKRPMPLWKRISFNVRKKLTTSQHGF